MAKPTTPQTRNIVLKLPMTAIDILTLWLDSPDNRQMQNQPSGEMIFVRRLNTVEEAIAFFVTRDVRDISTRVVNPAVADLVAQKEALEQQIADASTPTVEVVTA